ncbi:MAG TPA: DUF6338 family protein [Solirubrobacterales bacterium]|nr:DUF6338 family protein [Solirubrobacterales bacterium]
MTPDTGTAILVLAIFVLPGFITLLFRERLYVVKGQDTPFERLLQALFNSAIVFALIIGGGLALGLDKADLSEFYRGEKTLGEDLIAGVIIFLVLPIALAVIGSLWMSSKRLRPWLLRRAGSSEAHNMLSGWNELFGKQDPAMIRATLSDGRVMGGFYGDGSLAGYSQHTQDLYLSQRWELDAESWFVAPAPNSLGVWLPRESIVSLEVYALKSDDADLNAGQE